MGGCIPLASSSSTADAMTRLLCPLPPSTTRPWTTISMRWPYESMEGIG
uniref:Uncharacterized protein n=1 Tax=Setaria italica TaxID=4555 RepID=K4AP49_SETIT